MDIRPGGLRAGVGVVTVGESTELIESSIEDLISSQPFRAIRDCWAAPVWDAIWGSTDMTSVWDTLEELSNLLRNFESQLESLRANRTEL